MFRIALGLFCALLASAASAAEPLRVTLAGDYGANPNTIATLKRIEALAPELHIALGDLAYRETTEAQWCALVKEHVKRPFLLLPGNHESDGHDGHIDKFSACLPYAFSSKLHGQYPRQYFIDVPQANPVARFILISPNLHFDDGQVEYLPGNAHMKWLTTAIDSAREKHIPWVIVGMHKVCVSTEQKTCEVGTALIDTLIAHKVDAVFSGHVHGYERTLQLGCMKPNVFAPECLVDKGDDYAQGAGTVFITAGTGGRQLRHFDPADPEFSYFARTMAEDEGAHYGPSLLEITPERLFMRYIDSRTALPLDSFSLSRDAGR